jgi:hypothetical protein
MGHYVDASVQTLIEGLTRDPAAHPSALRPANKQEPPTDTPTPPDDMAIDKLHFSTGPAISKADMIKVTSPTLLLRRKTRPPMVARISMPENKFQNISFDIENPASPPPTEAILSPLPAVNRLHAGHTPIIPRARSPLPQEESDPPSPVADHPLSGPLFLPPQPGDGAEDAIPLTVLDAELEKLRLEQEREEQEESDPAQPEPMPTQAPTGNSGISHLQPAIDSIDATQHNHPSHAVYNESEVHTHSSSSSTNTRRTSDNSGETGRSSGNSGGTRRSSRDEVEVVDGVRLKKPKMNLGAPLGQA